MGDFARPANQLASVGVPLGPLPRPETFALEWPIGMTGLWLWTITDLPDNFKRLDGSTLSADEFPVLARLAGVASGGTITLPDTDGKFMIGVDAADATHDTVRETGGAKTHSHTVDSHTHLVQLNTAVAGGAGGFGHASQNLISGSSSPGTDSQSNMPPFMAGYWVVRVK